MADKLTDSVGLLPNVCCPQCHSPMAWVVNRERMTLSREKIACQSHGCPKKGEEYKVPAIVLERA